MTRDEVRAAIARAIYGVAPITDNDTVDFALGEGWVWEAADAVDKALCDAAFQEAFAEGDLPRIRELRAIHADEARSSSEGE